MGFNCCSVEFGRQRGVHQNKMPCRVSTAAVWSSGAFRAVPATARRCEYSRLFTRQGDGGGSLPFLGSEKTYITERLSWLVVGHCRRKK